MDKDSNKGDVCNMVCKVAKLKNQQATWPEEETTNGEKDW